MSVFWYFQATTFDLLPDKADRTEGRKCLRYYRYHFILIKQFTVAPPAGARAYAVLTRLFIRINTIPKSGGPPEVLVAILHESIRQPRLQLENEDAVLNTGAPWARRCLNVELANFCQFLQHWRRWLRFKRIFQGDDRKRDYDVEKRHGERGVGQKSYGKDK